MWENEREIIKEKERETDTMRKQERKREGEIKRTERSQHRDDVFEVDKLATEKKSGSSKK